MIHWGIVLAAWPPGLATGERRASSLPLSQTLHRTSPPDKRQPKVNQKGCQLPTDVPSFALGGSLNFSRSRMPDYSKSWQPQLHTGVLERVTLNVCGKGRQLHRCTLLMYLWQGLSRDAVLPHGNWPVAHGDVLCGQCSSCHFTHILLCQSCVLKAAALHLNPTFLGLCNTEGEKASKDNGGQQRPSTIYLQFLQGESWKGVTKVIGINKVSTPLQSVAATGGWEDGRTVATGEGTHNNRRLPDCPRGTWASISNTSSRQ